MIPLLCPHCGHDESLTGHDVNMDGTILQRGGNATTTWREQCCACGNWFEIKMTVGPVALAVKKAEAPEYA